MRAISISSDGTRFARVRRSAMNIIDTDKEAVTATDVVCGMDVSVEQMTIHLEVAGQPYYFCSEGCEAEFKRHTEDYVIEPASKNGNV